MVNLKRYEWQIKELKPFPVVRMVPMEKGRFVKFKDVVAQNSTSTNSAMDAIRKAYIEGYGMGHHHTVESCYCPEQAADDWLSEQHQ